jgi:hypothetical protein
LSIKHVAPEPFTPLQPPYSNWYKPDLTYEYHAVAAGHNIHMCSAFKKKLMQSIKTGYITFKETPNMSMNPDTTKELMSSPKCRSVEVINYPARPGSNHKEVNCINYK